LIFVKVYKPIFLAFLKWDCKYKILNEMTPIFRKAFDER
jgi:hypothetical protein